jgi:hypothetical protein
MAQNDLAAPLRIVLQALDRAGIRFLIGGSLASSVHGILRATADVDIVADMHPGHAAAFSNALGSDFYADPDMISSALRAGRSFNVIHYASTSKFDIFPLPNDAFQRSQFERRKIEEIDLPGGEMLHLPLSSAEDTLLMKLAWYRAGGEVSERQWNDVRGIIAVQGDRLDRQYLAHWAAYLKVADLLEQALELHS